MRTVVRVIAGINALFGLAVGLLAVVSPTTAAEVFGMSASIPALVALIRMFGGLLAASGMISAVVAANPDESQRLNTIYAGCLGVNVAADLSVIAAGELGFAQLAGGLVLESILAVLLVVYRSR